MMAVTVKENLPTIWASTNTTIKNELQDSPNPQIELWSKLLASSNYTPDIDFVFLLSALRR